MKNNWVLVRLIQLKPYIHGRLYGWLWTIVWPWVRESDGYVPSRLGAIEMRLDLREDAERAIYLDEYDPPLRDFIKGCLHPGDRMVDIGANAGALSVTAANIVGREGSVLCVEPNPSLSTRLKTLAERNPLGNISVLDVAVGDVAGQAEFFISSSHPYSSLDPSELPDYPLRGTVNVQVRTLDDIWMNELGRRPIRLLKIDVQGFEAKVIAGGQRLFAENPPNFIVLELMGKGLDEARQALRTVGYVESGIDVAGAITGSVDGLKPGANLVLYRQA